MGVGERPCLEAPLDFGDEDPPGQRKGKLWGCSLSPQLSGSTLKPISRRFFGAEAKSWCVSHPAQEPSVNLQLKEPHIIVLGADCPFFPQKNSEIKPAGEK